MKNLQETMKQLQKASESLSKLSMDQNHPWKALSQMNQILDSNFWENLVTLSNHSTTGTLKKTSEIVPTVKKTKKKEKEKPITIRTDASGPFPTTDIFKTDQLVIICCELPGFDRESLEVTLTDQRSLEIKGKIQDHEYAKSRVQLERSFGTFCRNIELPATVRADGMKAKYQDGLLELVLTRDDAPRERKTTFKAIL